MVSIGVLGAGGRMGQAILAAMRDMPDVRLAGAVERAGHPLCGSPVGGGGGGGMIICNNTGPVARQADVLIDFTSPDALDVNLRAAIEGGAAMVIGTTGLETRHQAIIDAASRDMAVLQSANMSLGVNLLAALVRQAAAGLPDWDLEIVEMHHRHKVDAPSGTALLLGEAAAAGRGTTLPDVRSALRDGITGPRTAGHIGFASMRGGTVAGDHMVVLAGDGERIELSHRAESRDIFARGALHAARWLAGKPPGRYHMGDVLGL